MSVVARILPQDEWVRLVGTEAEALWPLMRKTEAHDDGDIVVIERDGKIVGCWALLRVVHAECLWIAPTERHFPTVGRRLLEVMKKTARAMGVRAVFTAATDASVQMMLERVDAHRLPGDHYMLPVDDAKE